MRSFRLAPTLCSVALTAVLSGCGSEHETTSTMPPPPSAGDMARPRDDGPPPSGPMLVTSDSDYEFNPVADQPHSAAAAIQVTNRGGTVSGALAVDVMGENFDSFVITADGCSGKTLAPAQACSVTVELLDAAAGLYEADLRIHSDAGGVAKTHLHGHVTDSALTWAPAAVDFGALLQQAKSQPITLTLTNHGGATTGSLTVPAPSDPRFAVVEDDCNGKQLAGGSSCAVTLQFIAGSDDADGYASTLAASSSPGGSVAAKLSAKVDRLATISITSGAFGSVGNHYQKTSSKTITVSNVGTTATTVSSVGIDYGDYYGFSITSDDCTGKTLQASDACALTVLFDTTKTSYTSPSTTLRILVDRGHAGAAALTATVVADSASYTIYTYGYGTVSSSDGQTCAPPSTSCTFIFRVPSYSSIYLTETPSDGYVFNYWTGSICSGYYSCYFTPDASAYYPSVTAYFTKKP